MSDLRQWVAEGILKMWESPGSIDIGGSTFCSDHLDEASCKRQGNGFGIINNMINRVWLAPKLARIVGTSPGIGSITGVHWNAGLVIEKLLDCCCCVGFDGPIVLMKDDWFVLLVVDNRESVSTWQWNGKLSWGA